MIDKKLSSELVGAVSAVTARKGKAGPVVFSRRELGEILCYYGQMVAAGRWRDYAIDHFSDRAVFSIFRNSAERPLFRIEKCPKLANCQGLYRIASASGHILRRGHDLRQALRVFDRHCLTVI